MLGLPPRCGSRQGDRRTDEYLGFDSHETGETGVMAPNGYREMGSDTVHTTRTIETTFGAALAMLAEVGGYLVRDDLLTLTPLQYLLQWHPLERDAAATLRLEVHRAKLPPATPCGELVVYGTI